MATQIATENALTAAIKDADGADDATRKMLDEAHRLAVIAWHAVRGHYVAEKRERPPLDIRNERRPIQLGPVELGDALWNAFAAGESALERWRQRRPGP